MITFKTTIEKPVFDSRQKLIGNFFIYITIQKISMDRNMINPEGFYYYKDENNNVVMLDSFKNTILDWNTVRYVEDNILNSPFVTQNLEDACKQRAKEMLLLRLTQENGENYEILVTELEEVL